MKYFFNLITIATLSTVLTTTAFAAPQQDHKDNEKQRTHQQQHKKSNDKREHQGKSHQQSQAKLDHHTAKKTTPVHNWKVGGTVPSSYHSNNYQVAHNAHKLPKPEKNQRWIKVNGNYILENVSTHKIIKIVAG